MTSNMRYRPSLKQLVHGLGSIKLAVPLLVAIASILIGATFYEADVGSRVVQQEIYKSPWFGSLMFLLAVNLGTSTLLRYPWKGARKIGFAITHWGLVVIIAGSAAVIHLSAEGMMLVRTDGGPVNAVRVDGDCIEVATPEGELVQAPLLLKANGSVVPKQIGGLSLLGYSNHTINTVHFEPGGKVNNPAVRLTLQSNRMGQSLERWLAIAPQGYNALDIGPASLQITQVQNPQALQAALSEPEASSNSSPLNTSSQANTSSSDNWGTVNLSWLGQTRSLNIAESLHQPITLVGQKTSGETSGETATSSLNVEIMGFWPDFRLDENRQPTTTTERLQNPAVQIKLSTTEKIEHWFVFGKPGFEPIRAQIEGEEISLGSSFNLSYDFSSGLDSDLASSQNLTTQNLTTQNLTNKPNAFFRIVIDATGNLHYAAKSSKGFQSGPIAVGDAIIPGWTDFKVTLAEYIPQAQVARQIVALPENSAEPSVEQGDPALLVQTDSNQPPTWVRWGEPTAVQGAQNNWYVAFSPQQLQLPFSLKLNDFIVERNEGSESVAMWTSDISLIDSQTQATSHRRVWMNHPTWFNGWKIAQASWNPGDLSQSTLQIKREPWWVTGLTWLGSLMVTIGVATMFYGRIVAKAIAKKFKKISDFLEPDGLEGTEAPEIENTRSIPLFNALLGR